MCLVFTSCVGINKVVDIAASIDLDRAGRNAKKEEAKPVPKDEKPQEVEPKKELDSETINSRYSQLGLFGCFASVLVQAPMKVVEDAVDTMLSYTDVDLYISKEMISRVAKDLDLYVSIYGKISPDDFWSALSPGTAKSLNVEIMPYYKKLNDSEFLMRKKTLAYSFLYHLESAKESGTYKFKYDSRIEGEDSLTEFISFNGSKTRKGAEKLSDCGYFRFSDIEVERYDDEIVNHTLCYNKQGSKITITENSLEDFIIDIDSDIPKNLTLSANDTDVIDSVSKRKIRKGGSFPKYEVTLTRHAKGSQSFSKLTYRKYNNRLSYFSGGSDVFTNMECRTLVNRE